VLRGKTAEETDTKAAEYCQRYGVKSKRDKITKAGEEVLVEYSCS
jgi:hypothetical protein